MKPLTLAAVADFASGTITAGRLDEIVEGVSTDSRKIGFGQLFVALEGERFDGHDYVEAVIERGAAAVMVRRTFDGDVPPGAGIIRVSDTLVGLQCLARCYRRHLGLKVVGITGSNGKTSTKDFVASVLSRRFQVNATKGNLNNHIGLPLTILETDAQHDCGVWEMGTNHPGEIEVLADIARPNIGVITNIGIAHIEHMKTQEAIAIEKGMLAEAIGKGGSVILNAEDKFTPSIAERTSADVTTIGFDQGDIRAEGLELGDERSSFTLVSESGTIPVSIPVPGRHMVANALLAAAVGMEFGMELDAIAAGLAAVEFTGGRLQRKEVRGIVFIDDSYNANPDSMRAAMDTFSAMECAGRKFAIMGGMGELGEQSVEEHESLGALAAESGIDFLISVGDLARPVTASLNGGCKAKVAHFADHAACVHFLSEEAKAGDLVLVKGSRSAAMEQIIEGFKKEADG